MSSSDLPLFLSQWLRAPLRMGALVPSGGALARTLALQALPSRDGPVLELGAGTGVVTRALLARGIAPQRLVLVERDPVFCRLLRQRFPSVRVVQTDARRLVQSLATLGIHEAATIISGLPLLSLPFTTQHQVLRQSFRLLVPNGTFVQFTYGLASPVHPALLRRLELVGRPVARVLLNLPPAVVWRYTQRDAASPPGETRAAA